MFKRIKRIHSSDWFFHGLYMIATGGIAFLLEAPVFITLFIAFIILFSMFIYWEWEEPI